MILFHSWLTHLPIVHAISLLTTSFCLCNIFSLDGSTLACLLGLTSSPYETSTVSQSVRPSVRLTNVLIFPTITIFWFFAKILNQILLILHIIYSVYYTTVYCRSDLLCVSERTWAENLVLPAEFSAHVSSDTHNKSDLLYTVLCNDDNWYRRGIKEVFAIHKIIHSFASPTSRLLVLFTTIFLSLRMW